MRSHSGVDNDMNQPVNPGNPCNPLSLQYLMLQAPSAAETGLEMRSHFAQALTMTWTRVADHYLHCKITYGRTCHCNGLFDFTDGSLSRKSRSKKSDVWCDLSSREVLTVSLAVKHKSEQFWAGKREAACWEKEAEGRRWTRTSSQIIVGSKWVQAKVNHLIKISKGDLARAPG